MSTLKTTNVQHPSAADPAIELDAAGKLWLAGGKVLQIVRATDTTDQSTTSTTFVDVTGVSVTITPQKSTSAVLIISSFWVAAFGHTDNQAFLQITDSSNNPISGAESLQLGDGAAVLRQQPFVIARATPATTSAVTYKLRFKNNGAGTVAINGSGVTTQMYAIEVSA